MTARSSPFRVAVAVLLAVAIPFCCCSSRLLLGAFAWAGDRPSASALTLASFADAPARRCHGGHGPCGAGTTQTDPQTPADPDPEQGCACGMDEGKLLTADKPTVELPAPVIIAVVGWTPIGDLFPGVRHGAPPRDAAFAGRPATALLRMHCALNV